MSVIGSDRTALLHAKETLSTTAVAADQYNPPPHPMFLNNDHLIMDSYPTVYVQLCWMLLKRLKRPKAIWI